MVVESSAIDEQDFSYRQNVNRVLPVDDEPLLAAYAWGIKVADASYVYSIMLEVFKEVSVGYAGGVKPVVHLRRNFK